MPQAKNLAELRQKTCLMRGYPVVAEAPDLSLQAQYNEFNKEFMHTCMSFISWGTYSLYMSYRVHRKAKIDSPSTRKANCLRWPSQQLESRSS